MRQMDEFTLKKAKTEALEVLVYFKNVCDTNNLAYYITGGTLLDTVRHYGKFK